MGAVLPEARLPADVRDRLPATTPRPPWRCSARAVVWWQRGGAPVPDGPATLPLTVAAIVDYLDTPIGPYREIFAGTLLARPGRPAVRIPFIAVDSTGSLQAGRTWWGLPKVLASFTGSPVPTAATGDGWSVRVSTRALGPPVPVLLPCRSAQDGRSAPVAVRGLVRPAAVRVLASGPTLTGWLGRGRHAGLLASGTLLFGAAE